MFSERPRNLRELRDPQTLPILGRPSTFQPRAQNMARRVFVGLGIGAMVGLALGKTASNYLGHRSDVNKGVETFNQQLNAVRPLEVIPEGSLIPEDERTGKEWLTGLQPDFSVNPLVGGYKFENEFTWQTRSMMEALPDGTAVNLLVPDGSQEAALAFVKENYPHLICQTYQLPVAEDGYEFAQDVVCSTGIKDEKGRIVLVGSSVDARNFGLRRQLKMLEADRTENMDTVYNNLRRALCGWLSNSTKIQNGEELINHFGDEILAASNPNKFALKYAPLATEGGDLKITRMPNGEIGLIIGKANLSNTLMAMQIQAGVPYGNLQDVKDFNTIEKNKFLAMLAQLKADYKKYFGVDHVIILDEPHILEAVARNGYVKHTGLKSYAFFHRDMIVDTATNSSGEAVAFCTTKNLNTRLGTDGDFYYLQRIRDQFLALGFKIETLECGPAAAMNYANVDMFNHPVEGKTVMLPQYGVAQDERAAQVYARNGFKVRPVDKSPMKKMSAQSLKRTGSVHCGFTILS